MAQLYYLQFGGQDGGQINNSHLSLKWLRCQSSWLKKNASPKLQFCCKLANLMLTNNFDSNERTKATMDMMRTRASEEVDLEEHILEIQPINTGTWDNEKTHGQLC